MSSTLASHKKSELRRLHILDQSFELVLRKGFTGVGLQEILTHCNVPKGSFYHYFASKEAFGTALLAHYISNYQERLNTLWQAEQDAYHKISSYFQHWIAAPNYESGWADHCLIVKLAAEVADLSEDMRLIMNQGINGLIARIAQLIEQGQQDKSIQINTDPHAMAYLLYQMWLGAALLSKVQKTTMPLQHAFDAMAHMLQHNSNT